jgi:hypothetical protein
MSIPDSLTLKKAVKVAVKIERLQQKLHELLGDHLELPPATATMTSQLLEVAKTPRRRGRPPGSGRVSADGTTVSPLAGKPRPRSASGPLGPAVVKVLQRYNRPMKVREILTGLEADGYQWTASKPLQTLYVRIGKLPGVRKVDEGLYAAEGAALTGIIPEAVAPVEVVHAPQVTDHLPPASEPAPFQGF